MKLEGKVAIVSAAGRGIGRGIAIALAEEGADVVVNSYREETTKAVVDEIKAIGRRTLAIPGDITKPDKIVQVVEDAIKTFGRIDILVNNIGGGPASPREPGSGPLAQEVLEWDSTYEYNLRAPALMCAAVMPHFMEQKSGKIVNISSIGGRAAVPDLEMGFWFVYASVKAGVIRLTHLLADILGPYNVNVNCICPGAVYTDANRRTAEMLATRPEYEGLDARELWLEVMEGKHPEDPLPLIPLRREQTVEDMGRAAVFLVSDDAVNITGQSLNIDGGVVKS